MHFKVIVTRDIKANVYSTPMFVPHIGQAIRSFGDACQKKDNDPNNVLGNHPEDFELILLGEYDDETGIFLEHGSDVPDTTHAWKKHQLAVGSNYKA
uniref:DNA binding protein VP4 n=1 Tax=Gokushovirinae environmental samples TaxID=1478972 RepID=A0A2R3UB00_9VIRU|nr:DNA binding protein VP4 [Gokushovirinae environmental samples]